jgi:hypothetical protein
MQISKKLREGGIVRSYQNHTYLITSTYIAGKTTILWLCKCAQWGTKRVWGTRGRGGAWEVCAWTLRSCDSHHAS